MNSIARRYKGRYAEVDSRYGEKPNVVPAIRSYVNLASESAMSPLALAIRFVLSNPQVSGIVFGASNVW